jgi:hypothetical protein
MKNGLSFFAFLKQHLEAPNQTRPLQRKFATCNSGFKIFFHYTTKIARPVMARAPHQNLFRHFQPITYTPSPIRTKTPKISAVHVSTDAMPGHWDPHPSLEVVAGGGARETILPALKTLGRPYTPFPLIGWNCHVETIFAAFFRSLPDVRLRRECLRVKDNGVVALDWVSGDDSRLPPESPVLILLVRPVYD